MKNKERGQDVPAPYVVSLLNSSHIQVKSLLKAAVTTPLISLWEQ